MTVIKNASIIFFFFSVCKNTRLSSLFTLQILKNSVNNSDNEFKMTDKKQALLLAKQKLLECQRAYQEALKNLNDDEAEENEINEIIEGLNKLVKQKTPDAKGHVTEVKRSFQTEHSEQLDELTEGIIDLTLNGCEKNNPNHSSSISHDEHEEANKENFSNNPDKDPPSLVDDIYLGADKLKKQVFLKKYRFLKESNHIDSNTAVVKACLVWLMSQKKDSTIKNYRFMYSYVIQYVTRSDQNIISELSFPLFYEIYEQLLNKYKKKTSINIKIAALNSFGTYLKNNAENIRFIGYKIPKEYKPFKKRGYHLGLVLTEEEIKTMLVHAENSGNLKALKIICLAYYGGLRRSEINSIRYDQIVFGKNGEHIELEVVDGKGGKNRTVRVMPQGREYFSKYFNDPDSCLRVFSENNDVEGKFIYRIVKDIIRECGIRSSCSSKPNPHDFRHAFATHNLVINNMSLKELKQNMGHDYKRDGSLFVYIHIPGKTSKQITQEHGPLK